MTRIFIPIATLLLLWEVRKWYEMLGNIQSQTHSDWHDRLTISTLSSNERWDVRDDVDHDDDVDARGDSEWDEWCGKAKGQTRRPVQSLFGFGRFSLGTGIGGQYPLTLGGGKQGKLNWFKLKLPVETVWRWRFSNFPCRKGTTSRGGGRYV